MVSPSRWPNSFLNAGQSVSSSAIFRKLFNYLNSNASYELVEVTLRKRTYTDSTPGQLAGMIMATKDILKMLMKLNVLNL